MSYTVLTRRAALTLLASPLARPAEMLPSKRIYDTGAHNAFTDLIRYRNRWFCAFREAAAHVSTDGTIRVLTSKDGDVWEPAGLVTYPQGDLRDPKLARTPSGSLMLTTAVAFRSGVAKGEPVPHRSLVYLSKDGRTWTEPTKIGDENFWLWRVNWRGTREALSIGYSTGSRDGFIRLYRTTDGVHYETLVDRLLDQNYPNESSIIFRKNGEALCLLRRDGPSKGGLLGVSKSPYRDWQWHELQTRIGGPHMIEMPDGRLLAAVRLYDGKVRTSLCWVDSSAHTITEFATLPSGGDTSYAGLVLEGGRVWVSYYSSHEGKTNIYLAKARV